MVLHGKAAAAMLNDHLRGVTIHRRHMVSHDMKVDLHMRVMERHLKESSFPPEYLNTLGLELGQLPSHVYDEMVALFLRQMTGLNQAAAAKSAFCHLFPQDDVLYSAAVTTDLFQLLRHYMSK